MLLELKPGKERDKTGFLHIMFKQPICGIHHDEIPHSIAYHIGQAVHPSGRDYNIRAGCFDIGNY